MRKYLLALLIMANYISYGQAVGGNAGSEATNMPNAFKGDIGRDVINVDHYTGTGSVGIPIYNSNVDGVNIDVSLGYSLKGIRVDEISSIVGLGWSLNTGGEITRQVNGIEDEVTLPAKFRNSDYTTDGFPYHDSIQGILVPNVLTQATQAALWDAYQSKFRVYDDDEPDAFFFNLCGRQVTVYFDPAAAHTDTTGFSTEPYSRLRIQMISSCYDSASNTYTDISGVTGRGGHKYGNRDVLRFIVTDEAGNRYYFNRGDYQLKQMDLDSNDIINHKGYYIPTEKWRLDTVVTSTGQRVLFKYSAPQSVTYTQNITEGFKGSNSTAQVEYQYKHDDVTYVKTYLDSIIFPNRTNVRFTYNSSGNARCDCQGERRLTTIGIYSSTNDGAFGYGINYDLQQAYFNSPGRGLSSTEIALLSGGTLCNSITANMAAGDPIQEVIDSVRLNHLSRGLRLKLKGISRRGFNGSGLEQLYTFDYNPTSLPPRFAPSKDLYGYYNGIRDSIQDGNGMWRFYSMPTNSTWYEPGHFLSNGATSREYNFQNVQASVLNRIQNAAGATTEIEFQEYTLSNPDSSHGIIDNFPICGANTNLFASQVPYAKIDPKLQGGDQNDGLIIWRITRIDKFLAENKTTTEYTYNGGERFNRGGYTWLPNSNSWASTCMNQSGFVGPMLLFNGSNHGFSEVAIKTTGFSNEILSTQKMFFTNLMYKENWISKSSMQKPTGHEFHTIPGEFNKTRMGLNYRTETYDSSGFMKSYQRTVFEPVTYGAAIRIARYLSRPYPLVTSPNAQCKGYDKYPYRINDTFFMRVDSNISVKRSRNENNTITEFRVATGYDYNEFNQQVSEIFWTDSKNQNFKKVLAYSYPHQPEINIHTSIWQIFSTTDRLLSYDVKAPRFLSNGTVQVPASFQTVNDASISQSNLGSSINVINALNYPYNSTITNFGTKLKKVAEVTLYDNANRILETYLPINKIYNSDIWDEFRGEKIAEVVNAKYIDIAHTSFESSYMTGYTANANKGNLIFDPTFIASSTDLAIAIGGARTGYRGYKLLAGSNGNYLKTNNLNAGTYLFSFWAAGSNTPLVQLMNGTTGTPVTPIVANTVGNWKLYTATVVVQSGNHIDIRNQTGATSTMYLDEVRLHPKGSSMVTTTYAPLAGPRTVCDGNHYITNYSYDVFGRLTTKKDMRGNIISQTVQGVNDQDLN